MMMEMIRLKAAKAGVWSKYLQRYVPEGTIMKTEAIFREERRRQRKERKRKELMLKDAT
jgi:hypothetical protein